MIFGLHAGFNFVAKHKCLISPVTTWGMGVIHSGIMQVKDAQSLNCNIQSTVCRPVPGQWNGPSGFLSNISQEAASSLLANVRDKTLMSSFEICCVLIPLNTWYFLRNLLSKAFGPRFRRSPCSWCFSMAYTALREPKGNTNHRDQSGLWFTCLKTIITAVGADRPGPTAELSLTFKLEVLRGCWVQVTEKGSLDLETV